jgi:hypothetical protein
MRRGALVLVAGLALGAAAQEVYFRANRLPDPGTLDGQLAWMKAELNLSDAQFARIRELHEASSPKLRALASEVAQMQAEFAAFEKARQSRDQVDFVEFARFVETRRLVNRECQDSARRLVRATAEQMTPAQREQYLGIVAAVSPPGGSADD